MTLTTQTRHRTKSIANVPAVLVVDDNPLALMSAAMMVRDAGYEAITAADADEAERALLLFSGIAVIITDIRMPGTMDGLELAAKASRLWPEIGILLVSGEVTPTAAALPAGARFLPKPYSPADISKELSVLGESSEAWAGGSRSGSGLYRR